MSRLSRMKPPTPHGKGPLKSDPDRTYPQRRGLPCGLEVCEPFEAYSTVADMKETAGAGTSMERHFDSTLSTQQAYDSIAARYAATWFDDPAMEATLTSFLKLLPERTCVLDAGCGPGRD